MPLPVAFGLQRGWPVGPGQMPPPSGVPANALLSSFTNNPPGYVRNDSGGYVLRSYT